MPEKKDLSKLSPMMRHYISTKENYRDCILFYRLGDFYEMFFEDAVTASKELELTLTGKSCGMEERAPMCGVPFHAVDNYINRLVSKGYKVAICEQVSDPKSSKGMVEREVVRVVTPGTNMNVELMDSGQNNYLLSLYVSKTGQIGLCSADITTGEFNITVIKGCADLLDELVRLRPREIISNEGFNSTEIGQEVVLKKELIGVSLHELSASMYQEDRAKAKILAHFGAMKLEALGLSELEAGAVAGGALLSYLSDTQMMELSNLTRINTYNTDNFLCLDQTARRNLELIETMRDKSKKGSLLWVLDNTCTAMGSRKLRSFLEEPLLSKNAIERRLDGIEELIDSVMVRDEIREYLQSVYDLERILGKISYGSVNPRDLISLKVSLSVLPALKSCLERFRSDILIGIRNGLDELDDIKELISSSIEDEPPLALKDGGIIKAGYNEEVDSLRQAGTDGKKWLYEIEERERERTGIRNLKIKFSKVFGYAFEVTNSFLSQVPEDYKRKQTLTGAERFITEELKELEDKILHAEERLSSLEYGIFSDIRDKIREQADRIQSSAKAVALLDALCSLAVIAERNEYRRPEIRTDGKILIKNGRHPVVEHMMNTEYGSFIPNDVVLDNEENQVSIITGPNMAGKSTYMRSCALITLMAQIGSFVPADEAQISIVDKIFTRVGASDDLSSGQSTFMIEMTEVANILRNATAKSLLILDEIGRGTSTYDGLSIARAVVEYISDRNKIGAKALFATHYHELTELENEIPNVKNYSFSVKEDGDRVVFLRKLVRGSADRSYGIEVARLAGVPKEVLQRADEILEDLVKKAVRFNAMDSNESQGSLELHDDARSVHETKKTYRKRPQEDPDQMSLNMAMNDKDIVRELRDADIMRMNPMEAMNFLYSLQKKIVNRW